MMKRSPHWDELRTFVEVARDGSLSGAARRLGLSQPTVGRHIDALEQALGLTLFARSPRGLTPTPAAAALEPHVEPWRRLLPPWRARRQAKRRPSAARCGSPRARWSAARCCRRYSPRFVPRIRISLLNSRLPIATRTWPA